MEKNPWFSDKRVLVTGACGTVGRELIRQLIREHGIRELIGIDNNESALFFLEQEYSQNPECSFFLADVRDRNALIRKTEGIDIIFHTAAFKHVHLCERSPFEAVQTNIIGTQHVISAAIENQVEKVIFTSSDKAVNPTNVMGTSKLMSERIMTAANTNLRDGKPVFASTRFGNVLGSRGSVIPVFKEQIQHGGPVTVTDPNMTRFIMSITEAVRLVTDSVRIAKGGEIFVTKMPAIRIRDLAEIMIRELAPLYKSNPEDLHIEFIGTRAGEKMYEELLSHEETRRSIELDRYFVVLPAFSSVYREIEYEYPNICSRKVTQPYHSGNQVPLSKAELSHFLKKNKLID